jgi:ATP-dependent protease ClpP protease subunit
MSDKKDYVYATPVATEYRYYLDTSVTETEHYQEMFELLQTAGENDCVRIIISNFGGSLSTCVAIVNAIRNCRALTVGVLASVAYSAGGAIWLACEAQEVGQHTGFLAHDGQGSTYGSLHQQKMSIEHDMAILRSLYEDVYENFLTTEEIETVLKNGDLWISGKDIVERLEKREALYKQQDEEAAKKQEAEIEAMFNEPEIPQEALAKLTKAQLISYIKGDVDVVVGEDGSVSVVAVDNEDLE